MLVTTSLPNRSHICTNDVQLILYYKESYLAWLMLYMHTLYIHILLVNTAITWNIFEVNNTQNALFIGMFKVFYISFSRYSLHSLRLFLTSTIIRRNELRTPRPKRKANGILSLPLRSMIAEDTNGPMKEDVLPIMENKAKNRNSLPLGTTSEIIVWEYEYHLKSLQQ